MNPSRLLFTLCCIAALVVPAIATAALSTLPFHGVLYQSSGACVVDRSPDGALDLTNIGSSGQDGVSFACSHLDGMSVALAGSTLPSDAGMSMTFSYAWTLTQRPAGSHAVLSSARPTPGGPVTLSCDLTDFALPSDVHCVLHRGGQFVADKPGTYQLSVVVTDALGRVSNPRFSVAVSRSSRTMHAAVSLPSVVTVQFADGTTEDCDDVDFVCALDTKDEDCDGVSASLRVVAPPSSSVSHVHCADGSCRVLDRDMECLGNSVLSMSASTLDRLGRPAINTLTNSADDGFVLSDNPRFTVSEARPQAPRSPGGAGGRCALVFESPSLAFDPVLDEGACVRITLQGNNFSGPAPSLQTSVSGSCVMTVSGHQFSMQRSVSFGGGAPESVAVLDHGVEVARYRLQSGFIYATSPATSQIVVSKTGPRNMGWDIKVAKVLQVRGGPTSTHSQSVELLPRLRVGTCPYFTRFVTPMQFTLDGQSCTGDEVVSWTAVGDDGSTTEWSSLECHVIPPSSSTGGSSSLRSLHMLDLSRDGQPDVVVADASTATPLSTAHTCVTMPVLFERTSTTGVRGYSVDLHLSSELAACGTVSVVEGDYLSRVAGTQMFVTDHGSGHLTVDCSVLGPVCGATGDGELFSLQLSAAQPVVGDYGAVTIDNVVVRDCSNHPVAGDPGGSEFVHIDFSPPSAITALTATQQKFANGPRQTTSIVLAWPQVEPTSVVDVYERGFGNYPSYSHGAAPGSVPPTPLSRAAAEAAGWTLVSSCSAAGSTGGGGGGGAGGMLYCPSSRDFLYFCAFVVDDADNESPVSNRTSGTLDYHLGDVTDGFTSCSGDNQVDITDVSLLGAHYGAAAPPGSSFSCLDVGPTSDFSVDAMPTTDGKLNFEELMLFSMNYSVVSAPQAHARPTPMAANAARVALSALPAVGSTFEVPLQFDGTGDALGVSTKLDYDHNVLEQVSVAGGTLLDQQERAGVALSSEPGDIDVALLGAGDGISGSGELARVTFKVKAAGDPALSIRSVTARDAQNHPVGIAGVDGPAPAVATGLSFSYPNPFTQSTAIRLSLRQDGNVRLAVYDVAGRRVRVLLSGMQPAGARTVTWDGRDDSGIRMAPGAYVVRMEMANHHESRTVRLVR